MSALQTHNICTSGTKGRDKPEVVQCRLWLVKSSIDTWHVSWPMTNECSALQPAVCVYKGLSLSWWNIRLLMTIWRECMTWVTRSFAFTATQVTIKQLLNSHSSRVGGHVPQWQCPVRATPMLNWQSCWQVFYSRTARKIHTRTDDIEH